MGFLYFTGFVPSVVWESVVDDSPLRNELVRLACEDFSFEQEEVDGIFESAITAYVPHRSTADAEADRLYKYINDWSQSESMPGLSNLQKRLFDDWSIIRSPFVSGLASHSLEPPLRCLVFGLFVSDIMDKVLAKLIGDEEHEGREPIRRTFSAALITVILPVDLLPPNGRRLLRSVKRQMTKDLHESGWSPVGVYWRDFGLAINEGYGDDDVLLETPQPTRVKEVVASNSIHKLVDQEVPVRALKFTEDVVDEVPRPAVMQQIEGGPRSPCLDHMLHPTSSKAPVRDRHKSKYYQPAAGGRTDDIRDARAIQEPVREGVVSPSDRHKAITAAKGLSQITPPYKGQSDSRRFSWLKATIRKALRAATADVPTHWYNLRRSIDINLFNQIPLPRFDPSDLSSFCRAINSVWEYMDTICEGKYALQQLLDEKPDLKQREDEHVSSFVARCAQWLHEAEICNHLVYTYEIRMIVSRGLRNTYLSIWSADLGEDLSFIEFCCEQTEHLILGRTR